MSGVPLSERGDEVQGEITARSSTDSARESEPAGGSGRSSRHADTDRREEPESSHQLYRPSKSEERLIEEQLSPNLQRLSTMCHLGIASIIGVLIRYYMEILYGPREGKVTDDSQVAFNDLPANVLGSFLMGVLGVTLKPYVVHYSALLSLGFTTGLMGCITTYASWNQRMLTMLANGYWLRALSGYFFGMAASVIALVAGADAGSGVLWIGGWVSRRFGERGYTLFSKPLMRDNIRRKRRWLVGVAVVFVGIMWPLAALGAMLDKQQTTRRHLWLACLVAPFGVWTRWHLSGLNGQGFGAKRKLAWLPCGTYLANMLASFIEAILAVVLLAIDRNEAKLLIGALQLGVLGCLSTVSTFVLEAYSLHKSGSVWRAYKYMMLTIFSSFLGGLLLYALPVWLLGYRSKYNHLGQL